MAFAAPRSFKERARSLAASLGVRRPLHVHTRFGRRRWLHLPHTDEPRANKSKPARAAGEKEKAGSGRYCTPPVLALLFKGFHIRPKRNEPMVGWLGQMVSLCPAIQIRKTRGKVRGGARSEKC